MSATENNSALDYYYWNNKMLYLTANKQYFGDFERNFQNAVVLSKNNSEIEKIIQQARKGEKKRIKEEKTMAKQGKLEAKRKRREEKNMAKDL